MALAAIVLFLSTFREPCAAAGPSDFAHAWSIVTTKSTPAYRIELPGEVVASTRYKWADVAVFDAANQPMRITISWPSQSRAAVAETAMLYCQRHGEPASRTNYRCSLDAVDAVAVGALGVRLKTVDFRPSHDAITLTVRDENGGAIASLNGVLDPNANNQRLGAPIAFAHAVDLHALDLEFSSPGFDINDARLVLSPSRSALLNWYKADLLQADNSGKRLLYSLDGGNLAVVGRFTFAEPIPPITTLKFSACRKRDCSDSSNQDALFADPLSLGSDGHSYPVWITGNSRDRNALFLQVESSAALLKPPLLEIGGPSPALDFVANGIPPYTLAAGRSDWSSATAHNPPPQIDMPSGIVTSSATLAPYSRFGRLLGLLADLTGPGLFLFALALSLIWASWPSLQKYHRARSR